MDLREQEYRQGDQGRLLTIGKGMGMERILKLTGPDN